MKQQETFYISTPIYYPSSNLHIGHTYCTVAADAMARFKRLQGYDVMFLTGTDEHGKKIQTIADEHGVTPKAYVDKIVAGVKDLWKTMDISYDRYIRTTDADHVKRVQAIFMKLYEKGDIYKSEYEGWYCAPCESFWTETQLKEGNCPDCGRPAEKTKESAYFFRMSKYSDRLIDLLENTPGFLEPESRKNEMVSFIKSGLEDLCISRSTFKWGIPVPIDEEHIIYVWLDALSNYITALGYPDDPAVFEKYWPCDIHLVGKEIVRFHSIIWPAMLMSMDLPMPKKVYGHGWILLDGGKMSKSKGNVVDPVVLIEQYGVDALKYFLLREYTFGQDGVFTNEGLLQRINSDLANDLGNLLSRTVSMIEKYNEGILPKATVTLDQDASLIELAENTWKQVEHHMDHLAYHSALETIWSIVRRANKYIDETMPWALAKSEADKEKLNTVLYNLAESLRIVSVLIYPFMHNTTKEIQAQLGMDEKEVVWEDAKHFGVLDGNKVKKGKTLFPRIDIKKELEALESKKEKTEEKQSQKAEKKEMAKEVIQEEKEITIDDFDKVQFKVGQILECKKHPKADKLLVSKVDVGDEVRQIVSGVAEFYTPEEMVGKKVIVVANLKPIKLRGETSKGMILFAEEMGEKGEMLNFVTTDASPGSKVK